MPPSVRPAADLGPPPAPAAWLHDDVEAHVHLSDEEKQALARAVWRLDNIELTTVGIDIGSSTSHLMFSRIHLRRHGHDLSSRFVVVGRRLLWASTIAFTPFIDGDAIDTVALKRFIDSAYMESGIGREQVDTGAVILTGEAIKRRNAARIAQLFSREAGKFVCASAGHGLECLLAAHGSGAAALSQSTRRTVLNVDIGGGTTKLALCRDGEVISSCAIAVGGRLIVVDDGGRVVRLDEPAQIVADALKVPLKLGAPADAPALDAVSRALGGVIRDYMLRDSDYPLARELLLTTPLTGPPADIVTFSGGVAEYIYERERNDFGDIARRLAACARIAAARLGCPLHDPGAGIRATAIGAAQFTVQVSGKTAYLGTAPLPLYNLRALVPALDLEGEIRPDVVKAAILHALERAGVDADEGLALGLRFRGSPTYARLRALAEGIAGAFQGAGEQPLVLMLDCDLGRSLGRLLDLDFGLRRQIVCLDGLELKELEYVDVGKPLEPTLVVPVVVKSLLFVN